MRNRLRIAPNPDAQTCRAPHPASQSVPESERIPLSKRRTRAAPQMRLRAGTALGIRC